MFTPPLGLSWWSVALVVAELLALSYCTVVMSVPSRGLQVTWEWHSTVGHSGTSVFVKQNPWCMLWPSLMPKHWMGGCSQIISCTCTDPPWLCLCFECKVRRNRWEEGVVIPVSSWHSKDAPDSCMLCCLVVLLGLVLMPSIGQLGRWQKEKQHELVQGKGSGLLMHWVCEKRPCFLSFWIECSICECVQIAFATFGGGAFWRML